MQIRFLEEARQDLRWFKQYYMRVFPAGRSKADRQYQALLVLLKTQPKIGHGVEDVPGVFEYVVPGIPFTVLYRLNGEVVEILRLYDQRNRFSNERRR
ncbi:type II toxin-antitoxin system RelE/ParE family toxin [Celeribacter sp.]|uniref:type II toxin-antitoxin system RelE/ParE family toxin n=1 Tax=Celeribacter sp. TaxID=1890673 RepID=UPI003A9102FA